MSDVFCKTYKNIFNLLLSLIYKTNFAHNLIGVKNHPEFYLNPQQMCEKFSSSHREFVTLCECECSRKLWIKYMWQIERENVENFESFVKVFIEIFQRLNVWVKSSLIKWGRKKFEEKLLFGFVLKKGLNCLEKLLKTIVWKKTRRMQIK